MSDPAPRAVPPLGLLVWALAAFGFFFAWVLRVSPSVMIEPLMAEFKVGGALLGTLSGLYFYTYALLQAPAGLAMDRWGPRRALAAAAFVTALGCASFAAAPSIEVAYLGRLLIGGGVAFAFLGSLVLASAWFPPRRFAMFSGLGMGIGLLGGIAGQAPLAIAVGSAGWRETMWALAAAALVLAAAMWLVIRDAPAPRAPRAPQAGGESVLRGLWNVVRHSQTLYIAAFAGLMSSTMLSFGALWGVPYTMQTYGLGKVEASAAMAPILFGFTAGAPSWGWLSDRIGRRKLPMLAGAFTGVASTAAALYIPGLALSIYSVLLFFVGFGAGAMSVSYAAAREHTAGGGTGAALGFVNMVSVLGGAVFQPLLGWLLDLQWDGRLADGARVYAAEAYRKAFIVLPVLYALGFVAASRVRETFCRPYAARPAA
ncbi:MAG: MFS transporter [Candidatus Odyssella sp.]|nr:MFS transporter [Candidatus Odyssella sp.]